MLYTPWLKLLGNCIYRKQISLVNVNHKTYFDDPSPGIEVASVLETNLSLLVKVCFKAA